MRHRHLAEIARSLSPETMSPKRLRVDGNSTGLQLAPPYGAQQHALPAAAHGAHRGLPTRDALLLLVPSAACLDGDGVPRGERVYVDGSLWKCGVCSHTFDVHANSVSLTRLPSAPWEARIAGHARGQCQVTGERVGCAPVRIFESGDPQWARVCGAPAPSVDSCANALYLNAFLASLFRRGHLSFRQAGPRTYHVCLHVASPLAACLVRDRSTAVLVAADPRLLALHHARAVFIIDHGVANGIVIPPTRRSLGQPGGASVGGSNAAAGRARRQPVST